MRRRFSAAALVATAVGFAALAGGAQTPFTDDAGRKIAPPARVERVLPAGPPAAVDLLVLAPEKLAGLPRGLTPNATAFLPANAASLPAVGRLTGHDDAVNLEPVTKAKPDLIVDIGYVGGKFVSLADRVQQQSGVPYALIGGNLADTPATLRKLGVLLGNEARAEALARYAEETLALVKSRLASLPAGQRPKLYSARGARGLETGVAGSINTEIIELAGARNVAAEAKSPHGLLDVTMEQLVAWQPDIIIVNDPGFYATITQDVNWRQLAAVQAKHVYLAPALPFGWIDEPPAANRLIGLRWLATLLHPALFPEDIRAEAPLLRPLLPARAER